MKLPVNWLREYVKTPLTDLELADALTMAGLEVEEITEAEGGPVFHTKITANRGDWASMVGTAREAAAALDLPLNWHATPLPDEKDDASRWVGVRVEAPNFCPRYSGKVIRNLKRGPSPAWMQERLLAAGMRPIDVVVDITNYVMLELGQPLHAFDYEKLPDGKIVVRMAHPGETLITLDGVERELSPEMLVICDRDKPVALAGIMGGVTSEVSDSTRHLFLESAHFDPGVVRRAAKALGLSTEASYRYERFVDPELTLIAAERACELLADLAGGEVVLGTVDLYPHATQPRTLTLRPARVNAILGTQLSESVIVHSLRRLGLTVDANAASLSVIVPTFRPDLVKEIDLVEEVGRMVGYETLPETVPPAKGSGGGEAAPGRLATRLRHLLTGYGLQEALTHSLAAPSSFDDAQAQERRVAIRMALSTELSGLRASLLPGLLLSLSHNLRRRQSDIRLFETGKVFAKGDSDGQYTETRHLAFVLTGASEPRAWDSPAPAPMDFFAAKGLVESLAADLHLPDVTFSALNRPLMHPGRCAAITIKGQYAGYVAELDPDAAKSELDVPASTGRIAVVELDADLLLALSPDTRHYHALPRFPAIARDLAVVVDAATPYALLENTARAAADPSLLEDLSLQSVYTGERVADGKKSVAIRLSFRAADRTLTDAEVDAQLSAVQTALADRAGAERR